MGRRRLRDLPIRPRLDGVDEIRELDAILDEEDGDVVAHQVCKLSDNSNRDQARSLTKVSLVGILATGKQKPPRKRGTGF